MKPDRSTLRFLNSFPEDNRLEGERLFRKGRVTQIFGNHLVVNGRVEENGTLCRTTLRLQGDVWEGDCSCHEGEHCSSVVATMFARMDRGEDLPSSPNEVADQSITEMLEEKLGRELLPNEQQFIDKLEKRYRRFETEGELTDHDLVRLNAKWPVETYGPIELWPVPPDDIVHFWNYVAYQFRNRNLAYPKFMDTITDLEAVEQSLKDWEREKAEEAWKKAIFGFDPGEDEDAKEVEFRVMLTPTEARLQWRPTTEEAGPYDSIQDRAQLDVFRERHERGALQMDDPSALILESFLAVVDSAEHATIRLENSNQAAALNRLFHAGDAATRMVNLDAQRVALEEASLVWECREEAQEPGMMTLQLVTAKGDDIPHAVRLLPGLRNLYLADHSVFPGPRFWEEGTEVLPSYEIPASLLCSEAGVAFLDGIDANLPEALEKRIEERRMRVRLAMRLNQKLTGSESEQLLVEVTAQDEEESRAEVLEREGWIVSDRVAPANGTLYRYERDALRPFPRLLEPLNVTWDASRTCFRSRVTKTFPDKFVAWYESLPDGMEITLDEHLQTLMADPVKASVTFDIVASEIDWFDLKVVVDVEGLNLSMQEIRALVAARGGFVRMKNGGWLRLQIDLTEAQAQAVSRIGLDPFDLSGETHRLHVLQLSEPAAKEVFGQKAWEEICERSNALKLQVKPGVPDKLQLSLRPYQIDGFHFLAYLSTNHFGGILADDMGLGKTVQSITWLLWLKESASNGAPVLVVCPKSVLDVWAGEVKKFAPHLQVQILRNKGDLDMADIREGVDVLVMNYSQLRVNVEKLMQQRWLAVILDEGQQIKNPDSKAAKAARQLEAENRLVLTGTPIENRLLDIWSLMAFAMPGVLGSRKYFRDRFDRRKDPNCQERLSARLRPFLLRRTKGQVAVDLPPRTEEDVFCKLDGKQEELYRAEIDRIQSMLLQLKSDQDFNQARFTVLQGLTRLRQICCHPGLHDRSCAHEESAKMTALFYLLDQLREEGHKVLVFSQFVTMLEIIRERLEEESRPYQLLTGQTKDRMGVIEEFQTSPDPSVFLLSLKAGGAGLNLTAASYVVLYDPWWNPAVENQAIDRTHRIGQENKVIAYRLIMRDSVEEKIRILQQQKEAVSSGVLGEESFARSLTQDDLQFLFTPGGG